MPSPLSTRRLRGDTLVVYRKQAIFDEALVLVGLLTGVGAALLYYFA